MSSRPYVTHPGVAMEQKAIAGLKEKTGRSLEEWVAFMKRKGPKTKVERIDWLKSEHGLGTMYAKWLADRCEEKPHEYVPDEYVEKMFSGKKAGLRPVYDKLLEIGYSLGRDVTATPCATMVPLRRKFVFAQLKPTTNTRLDLGLALGDTKESGRLIDTGGFAKKDRITHRIGIGSVAEIDKEVLAWLRKAYESTPAGT